MITCRIPFEILSEIVVTNSSINECSTLGATAAIFGLCHV